MNHYPRSRHYNPTPSYSTSTGGIEGETRTESITLSSAQIKQLFTTPQTIIPAPGAGLAIHVISICEILTYVAPIYVGSGLDYNLGANSVFSGMGFYQSGASGYNFLSQNNTANFQPNNALTVSCSGANPTNGNGTLKVIITYKIVVI
jgi:hypothetical protein